MNPAAQRLTGWRRSELLGRNCLELFEADRPGLDDKLASSIESTQFFDSDQIYLLARKGRDPVRVSLEVSRIHVRPHPLGLVAARDISGRIEAEARHRELEQALAEARKLEALGRQFGDVAHDFKNLITPMVSFAQMALEESPDDSPVREYLESLVRFGGVARELANQLLEYSRAETDVPYVPVSLGDVLRQAVRVLAPSFPSEIKLVNEVPDHLGLVLGDSAQLNQVAINLLNNARQALERRGGTIRLSAKRISRGAAAGQIHPALPEGDYLSFLVEDDGPGIDDEARERLFEPHFTTRKDGHGLGLALVHRLVKQHGGEIVVTTSPGKGASFGVFLPRHCPDPQGAGEAPREDSPGDIRTILLVDDDDGILLVGKAMLERLGCEGIVASSGPEALEIFSRDPARFSAVITDQMMPELRGDELARRLHAIRPDLPVILISGYTEPINENNCKQFGFKGFLAKPVSLETLRNVLGSVAVIPL